MKLCAYMIVRNEAVLLPYAIRSIDSLCDEIFVVDNGSTDGTPEIARAVSEKVRLLYLPGQRLHDPTASEQQLRSLGIAACREAKADLVLRWDADEVLYEGQEEAIHALWEETAYGTWWFQSVSFLGTFAWIEDIRPGGAWFWGHARPTARWGLQQVTGKRVLFRVHPGLRYVPNPSYQGGLHGCEWDSSQPRRDQWTAIRFAHLEWVRSNRRIYEKLLRYHELIADPTDWGHSQEFRDSISLEQPYKQPYLRPCEDPLPALLATLEIPAELLLCHEEHGQSRILQRTWTGTSDW